MVCDIAGNWVFSLRNVETLSWLMQFLRMCECDCRCEIAENRQWHEQHRAAAAAAARKNKAQLK